MADSKKLKILIVDDEIIVARALARACSARGHETISVHSGEEGLEKWLSLQPDIIMLDVVMPGLTGPQVIEEFHKRNAQVKPFSRTTRIVLMTAHSGIQDEATAKKLGAHKFIRKPFEDVFDLVSTLEKLVQ